MKWHVDICSAICRSLRTNKEKLREHLIHIVLHGARFEELSWRVDCIVASRELSQAVIPTVRLALGNEKVELSAEKFKILYQGVILENYFFN